MEEYEEGLPSARKRLYKSSPADEVNSLMWFQRALAQGIPISGPMLQGKALQYAAKLGLNEDFKASNGWLNRFRQRHGMTFASVDGESRSVPQETVDKWK